jgi:glycosyltransferase involved in cell wall biosynthesis
MTHDLPFTAAATSDTGGCGGYRVFWPYDALRRAGYPISIVDRTDDDAVLSAGIVVVQRLVDPHMLVWIRQLKKRGIRVVYDIDDNFHALPDTNPVRRYITDAHVKVVEHFISEADAVTVSTEELKSTYSHWSDRVFTCSNAVDDTLFNRLLQRPIDGRPKREGQIRIGWAGSGTHRADVQAHVGVLADTLRAYPMARVVTIGDQLGFLFPEDLRHRVEFAGGSRSSHDFSYRSFDERRYGPILFLELIATADLDLAVVPLEDSVFNRAKSDLKMLEFGALGIPIVASYVAPYRSYQQEAAVPLVSLANTANEWFDNLSSMINQEGRRREYALNNYAHVGSKRLTSQNLSCRLAAMSAAIER